MSVAGHNNPPSMAETADEMSSTLSAWLADNPLVADEDKAREVKALIDRGSLCVADLEDERRQREKPLTDQVDAIRNEYREPRTRLQRIVEEASSRLRAYLAKLKAEKLAAAEEAERVKQAAIKAALEAEAAEKEKLAAVADGEVVDVDEVFKETADAFAEAQRAVRASALAERETKVKVGGGFKRAFGLRSKETLIVIDPHTAITALGPTDDIIEAIIKSARAYRRLHNKLPDGVVSHKDDGE